MKIFEKETMEEIDLTMVDHNGNDLADHIIHQYGDDTYTKDGDDIIMEKKHLDWWCEWAAMFEAAEDYITEVIDNLGLDPEEKEDLEADLACAWHDITDLEDYPQKALDIVKSNISGKDCCVCGCDIEENEEYTGPDGETYCDDCYNRNFVDCDSCNEDVRIDDSVPVEGRYGTEYYCEHCAELQTKLCDNCLDRYLVEDMTMVENTGEYLCPCCV